MHWNPLNQILMENVPFLPVDLPCVWALVKKGQEVFFWISTSGNFQAKPLNTGRAFYRATKLAFKGWPETQAIPLIQSSLCEKGVPTLPSK